MHATKKWSGIALTPQLMTSSSRHQTYRHYMPSMSLFVLVTQTITNVHHNHPIFWSARKQKSVPRSSIEAEYMSAANNASKLWWICSLLTKLGITLSAHPVIWCENVSTTFLYANHVFHSRMKLAALDYHFITRQNT